MGPEMVEFLREVGQITGDASVGRGIVTCTGVTAAILATGWRLLRRKQPDRVKVVVDAPPGEKVSVRLGDTQDKVV